MAVSAAAHPKYYKSKRLRDPTTVASFSQLIKSSLMM